MSDSLWPHRLYSPCNSPGQNTGVGSLSLLQRIFPTKGSNPGLLHYRRILYQLSHQGSPRILEWVAYPFSSGPSWPRNQTGVSRIAGRLLDFRTGVYRQCSTNINTRSVLPKFFLSNPILQFSHYISNIPKEKLLENVSLLLTNHLF